MRQTEKPWSCLQGHGRAILVWIIIACAAACTGAQGADAWGPNLLTNPSVEIADPEHPSSPLGFGSGIRKGTEADPRMAWVQGGRSGNMGLKSEVEGQYGQLRVPWPEQTGTNGLFRFSCWYRTPGPELTPQALSLTLPGMRTTPYPSARAWTQARMLIPAAQLRKPYVQIYTCGIAGLRRKWITDEQGKRIGVSNALAVTVELDDFALRPIPPAAYQGNLIENPGFEHGTVGSMAPGYRNIYNQSRCTGFLDGHTVRTGKQSLRIECPEEGYKHVTFACNGVPVRPNDICTFQLWARSSAPGAVMTLRVDTNGRMWNTPYHWHAWKKRVPVRTGWTRMMFSFIVPGPRSPHYDPTTSICSCTFRPEAPGPCKVWVDDVEFVIETSQVTVGLDTGK